MTKIDWIDYHINNFEEQIDFLMQKIDFLKFVKQNQNDLFEGKNYVLNHNLNLELKYIEDEDILFRVSSKKPKSKIYIKTIKITDIKMQKPLIKNGFNFLSEIVSFKNLSKDLDKQIDFFEQVTVRKKYQLFLMEDIIKKYNIKPNNKSQENFIKNYYMVMNYNIGVIMDFIHKNNKEFPFQKESDFLGKKELVNAYLRSGIFG
jgi:hypothetical protein